MDDLAGPMISAVALMTIISGLMGIIIIFLVTSLIIEEGRMTISLLKVFGYRSREVKKLVLNSSTIVIILGFLLGIPLMLAVANGIYGYLGEMINMVLSMIVSPLHILISFILIMLVYQLTKMMCGRKIAKISMNEALKAGSE